MQYDIYAIGDPDFMIRILNGLAALSQGGTLVTMMKIGILCGAIGGGIKAIFSAGKEFPLFHFFISMLLGMAMFGPWYPCTVLVTPLNPVPGSIYGTGMTKIDNVPPGPAITGYLLSHIGVGLTSLFEEAFGTPNGFDLTNGGFLQKIQLMDAPIEAMRSGGTGPGLPALEESLGYFMHDCTMGAMSLSLLNESQMLSAPTVLQGLVPTTGGNGAGAAAIPALWTQTLIPSGGSMTQPLTQATPVACPDAYNLLNSAFSQNNLAPILDPAMKPSDSGTATSPTSDMVAAMSSEGMAYAGNVGDYVAGLMTATMAVRAGGMGPATQGHSALFSVATETAAEQRAYQAMGEENMFLRIMLPMTGFFESLVYALAPFMAFLIGLGPEGFRLIMKYAALTLWVMLWFPMLALVNLYEETQLEHATNMIAAAGNALSLGGVLQTHDTIVNMLTTGSELAASVPALTLSILYGGAITASALAGRLTGGDHINEKLPSPDAQKEMTVYQPSPLMQSDQGSGLHKSGILPTLPTISFSSTGSSSLASSHAELESASTNYLHSIGTQLQDTSQTGQSFQHAFTSAMDHSSGETRDQLVSLANKNNVAIDKNASTAEIATQLVKTEGSLSAGAHFGFDGSSSTSSPFGEKNSVTGEKSPVIGKFSAGGGVSGGDNYSWSTTNSNATTGESGMGRKDAAAIALDKQRQFSQSLASIVRSGLGDSSATSSGSIQALGHNSAYSKAKATLDSATESYTQTEGRVQSGMYSQSLSTAQIAKRVQDRLAATGDNGDALISLFTASGRGKAFEANLHDPSVTSFPTIEQRQIAAGYMTLAGEGQGAHLLPSGAEAEADRQQAFGLASDYVFSTSSAVDSMASLNPTRNEGLTGNRVDSAGETIGTVNTNAHGSSVTGASVMGGAAAVQSEVSSGMEAGESASTTVDQEAYVSQSKAAHTAYRAEDPHNPDRMTQQQKGQAAESFGPSPAANP